MNKNLFDKGPSSTANKQLLGNFINRHIGPTDKHIAEMIKEIGLDSLDQLIKAVVPSDLIDTNLSIDAAMNEHEYINYIQEMLNDNKIFRSYIGQGYYGTLCPSIINRNILENPGWYTQYTPYQPEISQGRLQLLLAFQTMICDLTAMEIANASMLDEASAAAEAMLMANRIVNGRLESRRRKFFVEENCFQSTIEVLKTYAEQLDIQLEIAALDNINFDEEYFGALMQNPDSNGRLVEGKEFAEKIKKVGGLAIFGCDIGCITIMHPPGEWGADIVYGNSQRFGLPFFYGGPHAAFLATKKAFIRNMPGRIVGVSVDSKNKTAFRLALQTREQHIRRDVATSNICTAQVLLAIVAVLYACYHTPEGLKNIFNTIHRKTVWLADKLSNGGYKIKFVDFFDTIYIEILDMMKIKQIKAAALKHKINFHYHNDAIQLTIDETVSYADLKDILTIFNIDCPADEPVWENIKTNSSWQRNDIFLQHPLFNNYHSETELLRLIKFLENKDLSLTHAMIPLGSCTMKLNSTSSMLALSWNSLANIHPFAPSEQTVGYNKLIETISKDLLDITGFKAISFEPRAGAQGEYLGLLAIRQYFRANKQPQRKIALIPSSAHGTNPASAKMCGLESVVIDCDDKGNINLDDVRKKIIQFGDKIACMMITYPSTHGVFEEEVSQIIKLLHDNGSQVYMDGANMNAQIGITKPAKIGFDVCHLNLHKTFGIPHGGGGPGAGPVLVAEHLKAFLPKHFFYNNNAKGSISATPWGNAAILVISLGYIKMLGPQGLSKSSAVAILNANYIRHKLKKHYVVLYHNKKGLVAHEFIIDIRPLNKKYNISALDVAKRMVDYGFHPPTMSFPVNNTLMIEPTECESKQELDRLCDALIAIHQEIEQISKENSGDNILKNAPHTIEDLLTDKWDKSYSKKQAVFPDKLDPKHKFWPSINRINDVWGDRNLICQLPEN